MIRREVLLECYGRITVNHLENMRETTMKYISSTIFVLIYLPVTVSMRRQQIIGNNRGIRQRSGVKPPLGIDTQQSEPL